MDDRQDHDGFWELLDETIEEILTEVDRMIALDGTKQHAAAGHHQADNRQRIKDDEHDEMAIMYGRVGDPNETEDLRRPQEEDEYWSISATAWSHISHARQTVLSHVGRINETSEGEQAPNGDCNKCAESGSECMVYRNSGSPENHITGGFSCSRCRFRSLACSHVATRGLTKKKCRAVRFDMP